MLKYFAKPGGWYDDDTPIKIYFQLPFIKNWAYVGGIRTSEFPLSEGYGVGEKYWSQYYCSLNDFYTKNE